MRFSGHKAWARTATCAIPSVHPGSQASQFSKALGMRSSDLPPLSRTPRAGEPALDRGANMLMPQVGLSWVHAA